MAEEQADLRPLAGLRVVDFTRLLPGAHAGMVLTDFGAEVVKVEAPPSGDGIRQAQPRGPWGGSGRHEVLNRGKRSVCLDLRDDADRELAWRLVDQADVVMESFRPGVMDRLGLGYDAVRERRPDMVYVSVTGYGQVGERSAEPSHDVNFLALSGLLGAGPGDGVAPAMPQLTIGDLGGGSLQAVTAVLLALRVRDRTGLGQHLDVAMLDGTLSLLAAQLGDQAAVGSERDATVGGRLSGAYACYRLYCDRDGAWWAVGALEAKFWAATVTALGLAELADGDHLDPARQRDMRERTAARFAQLRTEEVAASLAGSDTCVTLVRSLRDACDDPALRKRGALITAVTPDGRTFPQPAPWPRLAVGTGQAGRPPEALDASRSWLESGGWSSPATDDEARGAAVGSSAARWPARVFGSGVEPDPRFTLANERTFLAWARTALGLLAAAVVVDLADFSVPDWLSRVAGVVLAASAVVAGAAGWMGWMRRERALRHHEPLPSAPVGVVLAAVVAVAGVVCAIGIVA